MKVRLAPTALTVLLISNVAQAAPEFGVNLEQLDNGDTRVWMSYLAGENVTALNFALDLDVPQPAYVDARACLASLPKSHRGLCQFSGGMLRGVIYSPTNALLTDTNIGSINIDPGSLLKSGGSKIGVENVSVTAVTPQGITVNADVNITGPSKTK